MLISNDEPCFTADAFVAKFWCIAKQWGGFCFVVSSWTVNFCGVNLYEKRYVTKLLIKVENYAFTVPITSRLGSY